MLFGLGVSLSVIVVRKNMFRMLMGIIFGFGL